MLRAPLLLLALSSCTLLNLSFEGSACAGDHPCPGGLQCDPNAGICVRATGGGCGELVCTGAQVCNPYLAKCAGDALCHQFDDEHPITCPRRDFYLAPDGDDAHDGKTPQTAWATVSAHPLTAGDRVSLLPGDYLAAVLVDPQGNGLVACPIELKGPTGPDAGVATLKQAMRLGPPGWWLHDFDVSIGGTVPSLSIAFTADIRLERLHFHNTYDPNDASRDIDTGGVDRLQILDSVFDSDPSELLHIDGTAALVEGNRFIGRGSRVQLPRDSVVRNNDFTGQWLGAGVEVTDSPGALIVERNVFHEMVDSANNDFSVVDGAARVVNNTFINIDTGLASTTGVFRNNIVSGLRAGSGLAVANADGGYNLFDAVAQPYLDGDAGAGDLFAQPRLDADHVPTASSPAVDAADPATGVPPGGGTRADIGARERGATLTSDGRYCMPESP